MAAALLVSYIGRMLAVTREIRSACRFRNAVLVQSLGF
jgi:hypothetical protein